MYYFSDVLFLREQLKARDVYFKEESPFKSPTSEINLMTVYDVFTVHQKRKTILVFIKANLIL